MTRENNEKYFAYCPDCGTKSKASSLNNALQAANSHNERCRERKGRGIRSRFIKRVVDK